MGVVMVLGINAFLNDDRDYAAVGGMMALMATVMGGLARGSAGMIRYRLAVSMGYTRRAYMLVIVEKGVDTQYHDHAHQEQSQLEGQHHQRSAPLRLYAAIYPGCELDMDIFRVMEWWHYLVLILGVCLLDFLFGALLLRFGTKGFAAMWFPLCFLPLIIIRNNPSWKASIISVPLRLTFQCFTKKSMLSPSLQLHFLPPQEHPLEPDVQRQSCQRRRRQPPGQSRQMGRDFKGPGRKEIAGH